MDIFSLLSSRAGDFDPNSLESLGSFLRVLLASFVLGGATGKLYKYSYDANEPLDASLARSFLVLVPSLAVVFWVIKINVVLSLGLLGSLAFVRFRTPVRRVEDAAFVLVGIAVAITSAIEAYALGAILLGALFVTNVGLRFWRGRSRFKHRYAVVTFQSAKVHSVESLLDSTGLHKYSPQLLSARSYDGTSSFVFGMNHAYPRIVDELRVALATMDRNAQLHVFYPDGRLSA